MGTLWRQVRNTGELHWRSLPLPDGVPLVVADQLPIRLVPIGQGNDAVLALLGVAIPLPALHRRRTDCGWAQILAHRDEIFARQPAVLFLRSFETSCRRLLAGCRPAPAEMWRVPDAD